MDTLTQWFTQHEASLRLAVFVCVFCAMALWETLLPARTATHPKALRWANNLGLMILNSVVLRLLFPLATMGFAHFAQQQQWGLFNTISLPLTVTVPLTIITLDLCIYAQHVSFHHVPILWRVHRVHHMDTHMDVTTAARFHTMEILLSMCIKFVAIALLGPSVVAVILFEILLNASATFSHANIQLSTKWDKTLRLLIITPNMHRIHHSTKKAETDSNFGFFLSLWDKLFGTYTTKTPVQENAIQIGLSEFSQHPWRITTMLINPFSNPPRKP